MTTTHRVILDTDIGSDVDDLMALSLLLGTQSVDLIGITTVYGDTALRARIAKQVVRLAGVDIPVHAGRQQPLSGREIWWAGHEGKLYNDLDSESYDSDDAVRYLVDTVTAAPGEVDVVAIGPLTNIAAAITSDRRFAASIKHLWIMGGDFTGSEAEHNFLSDTTAARTVFGSGIPATVTGLEVTRRIEIREQELDRIAASGPLGELIRAEIQQWWDFWSEEWNVPHDPVTVLTLTAPTLFETSEDGAVDVDNSEREGFSYLRPGVGRARIITDLDAAAVAESIVKGICSSSAAVGGAAR